MVPGASVPSGRAGIPALVGSASGESTAQPLLRRKLRRLAAGPCAPLTLPHSWLPLPWPSSWTWRLRSSASRNLAFTSSMSGLPASPVAPSSALPASACPASSCPAAGGVAAADSVASASVVAADSASAVFARPSLVSCFALLVMRSSFAHRVGGRVIHFGLPADGPAARFHRVEQGPGLIRVDGELGDADREAGRVLEPDVLDIHPGGAGRVEQPGQLPRTVGDDHLDQAEVPRLAAVLARDAGDPGLAPVEQAGD